MADYITKEIRILDFKIKKSIDDNAEHKEPLNRTQLQIIGYLISHPDDDDVCQKDLENETNLKKASITGALDSLERKGLIKRVACEDDKRKNHIKLTQVAIKEKEKMVDRIMAIDKQIDSLITEKERKEFIRIAKKIRKGLNNEADI